MKKVASSRQKFKIKYKIKCLISVSSALQVQWKNVLINIGAVEAGLIKRATEIHGFTAPWIV